ncbi:dipeptide ABC transporter ATP-binding protein [Rouxiella sp. S1S-2]|uniref:dipeptide ABC transporter ATP-binding protein n=1 Tax=Rouxiella sp. S1S-2 TaxID=2653856 RepID=UPI00126592A0|nr:ABC transporter ATP-binding protein [Rouxiella sp. S1S-2]KAB7897157.1 dipeptide ABC transporter ATP-binding protein [Rouxiella sp. S1S-2]
MSQATFNASLNAPQPVLELKDVSIVYRSGHQSTRVVEQVSFSILPGEVVALVGESGSGKTTTAQSIIGLLAENGHIEHGSILLNGTDISRWSSRRLDSLRGSSISLIPQDPTSSLNPVKTVGEQVAEVLKIHRKMSRRDRDARVVELLTRVGLSHPEQRAKQYPHQLSGGMKQRVLIAIAIALQPALIIADEPTSALDVRVQKRILDLIDALRLEFGTAVLFVTHDLALAAERADRLLVFRKGKVQEQGITAEVLRSPKSDYTRQLFTDAPALTPRTGSALPRPVQSTESAIVVRNVSKHFSLGAKNAPAFRALDNVSFQVTRGTTHSLVGESGSGKTTLARLLLGFQRPDGGQLFVDGVDIALLSGEALRQARRKIQLVYQNPFASLDPSQTLFKVIEEPLLNYFKLSREERQLRVHEIAERVALPIELLQRKPHELSGGQRQRVALARALILEPQVLVLDEATSALDVTVQAQILRLLVQLQQDLGLTYLFISHDLATVRQISHTVSVLNQGKQVDYGDVESLFSDPTDAYTRELLSAIPGFSPLHVAEPSATKEFV